MRCGTSNVVSASNGFLATSHSFFHINQIVLLTSTVVAILVKIHSTHLIPYFWLAPLRLMYIKIVGFSPERCFPPSFSYKDRQIKGLNCIKTIKPCCNENTIKKEIDFPLIYQL